MKHSTIHLPHKVVIALTNWSIVIEVDLLPGAASSIPIVTLEENIRMGGIELRCALGRRIYSGIEHTEIALPLSRYDISTRTVAIVLAVDVKLTRGKTQHCQH